MKLTLKIWRQKNRNEKGKLVTYQVDNADPEMSMLECLDVLNESLIERGEEPVAFDHDCLALRDLDLIALPHHVDRVNIGNAVGFLG